MDPNNVNQTTNPSTPAQTDTTSLDPSQQSVPQQDVAQTQSGAPASQNDPSTAVQPDPNDNQTQDTTAQATLETQNADQASQTNPENAQLSGNYIEDVGEDLIDLLDEINEDENLVQAVADEMRLDKQRVKAILAKLLTKIDQGQITEDELALIMASTVADEILTNE